MSQDAPFQDDFASPRLPNLPNQGAVLLKRGLLIAALFAAGHFAYGWMFPEYQAIEYGDRVRVVGGFHKGRFGVAEDEGISFPLESPTVIVNFSSYDFETISITDLEVVEDEDQ